MYYQAELAIREAGFGKTPAVARPEKAELDKLVTEKVVGADDAKRVVRYEEEYWEALLRTRVVKVGIDRNRFTVELDRDSDKPAEDEESGNPVEVLKGKVVQRDEGYVYVLPEQRYYELHLGESIDDSLKAEAAAAREGQGAEGSGGELGRLRLAHALAREAAQAARRCQAAQTFPDAPPIRSSSGADFADDTEDRGTNVGNPSHTVASGCTMKACGTRFRPWRSGHTRLSITARGTAMRAKSAGAGPCRLCLAVLLLTVGVWVVAARADDPANSPKTEKPADKSAEKPKDKPEDQGEARGEAEAEEVRLRLRQQALARRHRLVRRPVGPGLRRHLQADRHLHLRPAQGEGIHHRGNR